MQWSIVLKWIKIMVSSMAYSVVYKENIKRTQQRILKNLLLRSF